VASFATPAVAQGPPPSGFTGEPARPPVVTAPADTTPAAEQRVGQITVAGNVGVDSARIVRSFDVLPGSRFNLETVQHGIKKLFALGLFEDAWVERREHDAIVDLVIHVVERPRIGSIGFHGNQKKSTADLEKKLFLRVGEPYSPVVVQTQIDTLKLFYREQGYARAVIDARADTVQDGRSVKLTFNIQEGERVRITNIEFRGITGFPPEKLKKKLATKKKGLFGGGEVKDESFTEDVDKVLAYLHAHGYRDAVVSGHDLVPGKKARDLTLVFTVDQGPLYWIGRVSWIGNQVVPTPALQRMWIQRHSELYDQSRIQKAQGDAYAAYAEAGYLYVGIEPRETVRDSAVDVEFAIQEGAPSNVRYIQISGNHGTREKVIRREISIHEGDRFKRSALVRTQGDIMRLGFFEDVQLDFSPAESTDVDINLKVKEKQVGTASAGAGYTAQSGLTGFLDLGHNNVLGNGQSLSLHIERGARTSNYSMSFTEPWFRDTPTLLGISAFNTNSVLDLYNEKRVGGSARVGRPLRWPDYSRGSLAYSLENVTIHIDKATLTAQDSIVLRGLKNGEPTLTSSVSASFLRNSANNPFYPTKGTRLTLDGIATGGLFGGAVNFHKEKVEGRAYLPSLARRVTTLVRLRFGFLNPYPDQNFAVPPYERFRLGGGTTIDPLRGYDDYMVVPTKFIRLTSTGQIKNIDSTTTPGVKDTSYFQTVTRYPGGRFMTLLSVEQQFPIAHPLHGVMFFDAGNTWDLFREARPFDLLMGAGVGIRLEIPLLGNVGFDFGYGFDRRKLLDHPKWVGHFLLGQTNF
jgi:outer membrane protein insertion porin family